MTMQLLERRIYDMEQVDRLLQLRAGTARRWIDGYTRSGKTYPPIIRPESTGDSTVSWGEFVEARYVRQFRTDGVPVQRLRPAIERMREQFNTPYPLASARPFVATDRELVYRLQEEVGLDKKLQLVVARNDQLVLSTEASSFFESTSWDENDQSALRVHPRGHQSPVVIDPVRQFGEPVIRSVTTRIIAEQFQAGESTSRIADIYELSVQDVEEALRFESAQVA